MKRELHRHPTFFGTVQEYLEDLQKTCEVMKCGFQSSKQILLFISQVCVAPIDADESASQAEKDTQYYRGRVSYVISVPRMKDLCLMAHLRFLEEDSGRQMMTESFNPIDVVE